MTRRSSLFFLIVLIISQLNTLRAQDPQFSQFYAAPMYLNPALVGIHQFGSARVNYRNQWPSIPAQFETYSFSIDYNFTDVQSSLGLIVNTDREGIAGLKSTNIGLQYAYQVRLNFRWTFRPAVEIGYFWRNVDFTKLTFGDQFDDTGQVRDFTGEVFSQDLQANFFDMSFGGIFFNPKIWLGFSAHHVLEPNQSLTGDDSPLRIRYSIHGGYKILFTDISPFLESKKGRERSITPTANYKRQGGYDQLDLGGYITLEPITVGLWYRGIPVKKLEGTPNNEALVLMFGVKMGNTTMGYSFDYTLSDLGIDSGGAHEISLIYSFDWSNPAKPRSDVREVKCPIPFQF